jgi:hypothetical protein
MEVSTVQSRCESRLGKFLACELQILHSTLHFSLPAIDFILRSASCLVLIFGYPWHAPPSPCCKPGGNSPNQASIDARRRSTHFRRLVMRIHHTKQLPGDPSQMSPAPVPSTRGSHEIRPPCILCQNHEPVKSCLEKQRRNDVWLLVLEPRYSRRRDQQLPRGIATRLPGEPWLVFYQWR